LPESAACAARENRRLTNRSSTAGRLPRSAASGCRLASAVLVLLAAALVAGAWTHPALAGSSIDGLRDPGKDQFRQYWYPHGAEISRFRLQQYRYGEIHEGDAVLIYVTETMNPDLQVKADRPGPEDIPVLKLNHVRKFFTGIYPYSILISVFERADPGSSAPTLKISTSVQEWCGHIYTQLNLEENAYRVESHSYFEDEADQRFHLDRVPVEDGLWTKLRVAPTALPLGEVRMIVSPLFARLVHRPLAERQAFATLAESTDAKSLEGNELLVYTLDYPAEKRVVEISFEKGFPHRIQRWEERYPGLDGEIATTRAERTHTIMIDYWNHHHDRDRKLLKKLGLSAAEMDAASPAKP